MSESAALLVSVSATPLLGAGFAVIFGRRPSMRRWVTVIGSATAGIGLMLSVVLAVVVLPPRSRCPVRRPVARLGRHAALQLVGDRVSAALTLLVCSVSTVVQLFADATWP